MHEYVVSPSEIGRFDHHRRLNVERGINYCGVAAKPARRSVDYEYAIKDSQNPTDRCRIGNLAVAKLGVP